jgi:hypothetical protein
MKTIEIAPDKAKSKKEKWAFTLQKLAEQVSAWVATEPGWSIEPTDTIQPRSILGADTVPILLINTPHGKLALEDKGENLSGRGVVEFYSWMTLRRVFLLPNTDGSWQVRVDAGFRLHQPWAREQFIVLANDLADVEDLFDAA